MVFTVHGIVLHSCCTYPIHCKNHETTITCTLYSAPTGSVGGVSDHGEDMLHEVNKVGLEELGPHLVRSKLL